MEFLESLDFNGILSVIGAFIAAFAVAIIIALVLAVLQIVGEWKAFTKAGAEGYTALIPMVDIFVMGHFSGATKSTMIYLLASTFGSLFNLIPFIGTFIYLALLIVVSIRVKHAVAKSFGYDVGMTLLLIFLPFIAWLIIGFGKAQYVGPGYNE